jgi:hypothetical protein
MVFAAGMGTFSARLSDEQGSAQCPTHNAGEVSELRVDEIAPACLTTSNNYKFGMFVRGAGFII